MGSTLVIKDWHTNSKSISGIMKDLFITFLIDEKECNQNKFNMSEFVLNTKEIATVLTYINICCWSGKDNGVIKQLAEKREKSYDNVREEMIYMCQFLSRELSYMILEDEEHCICYWE